MKNTPRWVNWVTNPEEDKQLDRPSTIEVVRHNEYGEYEHDIFIVDHASESFKEILMDPEWGNGSDAELERKITLSTEEWNVMEAETAQEFTEYKEWKANNKEAAVPQAVKEVVIKEVVEKVFLSTIEQATSEDIFKLKLDVFEKEEVQNADKKIKSRIRMSKDPFEIFSLYYSVMTKVPDDEANLSPAGSVPA
jgi:hypothetical protein